MVLSLILTVDEQRVAWLPQFVEHYRRLGVERFLISLHISPNRTADEVRRATDKAVAVLRPLGILLHGVLHCHYTSRINCTYQNRIRKTACSADDWIVWTDIDEFHEYPEPLRKILKWCDANGVSVVFGKFIDRVARGGRLEPFDPRRPIWEQYPLGAEITGKILGGETIKVAASRAHLTIETGHHRVVEAQEHYYPYAIRIHHFKWDAGVIERLKLRVSEEFKKACHWWIESQRFLDHVAQYGKIDLTGIAYEEPGTPNIPQ